MATIGNTDVGTQDYTLNSSDRAYSIEITMPEGGGIPTSVHAYIERGGSGTDPQIKGVIWDASDGSVLEVGSVADISSTGWQEVTFTSADKISAGTIVYVGFVFNRPGSPYGYIYSNVSGYDGKYDGSNSFSSPQTFDNIVNYSEMSIYLTYTPFRCGTYEITLDSTKVDSDLTHFPVPIFLSSSCGQGDQDLTAIFDALGSNSKKIKVFDSDWNQLYVEVEQWDDTGEEAVLWISKDGWTIASGTDTTIYLQYDADMADNDEFVGDVGSRTEVWDDNFRGVWHLDTSLKDSTSGGHDLINSGSTDNAGKIGRGREGNGSDQVLYNTSIISSIANDTVGTMSCWGYRDIDDGGEDLAISVGKWSNLGKSEVYIDWDTRAGQDTIGHVMRKDNSYQYYKDAPTNSLDPYIGAWLFVTVTQPADGGGPHTWMNDVDQTLSDQQTPNNLDGWFKTICTDATNDADRLVILGLPRNGAYGGDYDGTVDECRISNVVRSDAWIKADYYGGIDDLVKSFSVWSLPAEDWLGTWAKRVEITVDETNIDECLSHFPVPIFLSSSCGQSNEDLTPVFDEVGSSYQKIAVTEADGQTQLFVEVERWDDSGEEAVLWVSRDSWFIPTSGTNMYLYFDSAQANNTDYVGDVGSRTEVWDGNFKGVWHMDSSLKDSTSNNNDGTNYGTTLGSGTGGYYRTWDGATNTDRIDISNTINDISSATQGAVSVWCKPNTDSGQYDIIFGIGRDSGSSNAYRTELWMSQDFGNDRFSSYCRKDNVEQWDRRDDLNSLDPYVGVWHYRATTHDGSEPTSWLDGALHEMNDEGSSGAATWFKGVFQDATNDANNICIGNMVRWNATTGGWGIKGDIGEVRISDAERSSAWIKAEYNSLADDLLDFGTVEEYPTAGWGHKIYGIASGSFTKIYGVDVGNITKVCGVE